MELREGMRVEVHRLEMEDAARFPQAPLTGIKFGLAPSTEIGYKLIMENCRTNAKYLTEIHFELRPSRGRTSTELRTSSLSLFILENHPQRQFSRDQRSPTTLERLQPVQQLLFGQPCPEQFIIIHFRRSPTASIQQRSEITHNLRATTTCPAIIVWTTIFVFLSCSYFLLQQ